MDADTVISIIQSGLPLIVPLISKILTETSKNDVTYLISLRIEITKNLEILKYRAEEIEMTNDKCQSFVGLANELSIVELDSIVKTSQDLRLILSKYRKNRKDGKNEILDLLIQIQENVRRLKKDAIDEKYLNSLGSKYPLDRINHLQKKFLRLKELLKL